MWVPRDELYIDWDDDGYQSPYANVTERFRNHFVGIGLDTRSSLSNFPDRPAYGSMTLENYDHRYSAEAGVSPLGIKLNRSHAAKLVSLHPDGYRNQLWQGRALVPEVSQREGASRASIKLQGRWARRYRQEIEFAAEGSLVSQIIEQQLPILSDGARILLPPIRVGYCAFRGLIQGFLYNLALLTGSWSWEDETGSWNIMNRERMRELPVDPGVITPETHAMEYPTTRVWRSQKHIRNSTRLRAQGRTIRYGAAADIDLGMLPNTREQVVIRALNSVVVGYDANNDPIFSSNVIMNWPTEEALQNILNYLVGTDRSVTGVESGTGDPVEYYVGDRVSVTQTFDGDNNMILAFHNNSEFISVVNMTLQRQGYALQVVHDELVRQEESIDLYDDRSIQIPPWYHPEQLEYVRSWLEVISEPFLFATIRFMRIQETQEKVIDVEQMRVGRVKRMRLPNIAGQTVDATWLILRVEHIHEYREQPMLEVDAVAISEFPVRPELVLGTTELPAILAP